MILSVEQIRKSEQLTMQNEPITSSALMERAGSAFASFLENGHNLQKYSKIYVFCGPGNNGGDGLVVARKLAEKQLPVVAVKATFGKRTTPEFEQNWKRLDEVARMSGSKARTTEFSSEMKLSDNSLCIDALFGIGLTRPLEGDFQFVVNFINENFQEIVSVDVPSGMFADSHQPAGAACVRATEIVTFQFMKWAFFTMPSHHSAPRIAVLNIGLQNVDADGKVVAEGIEEERVVEVSDRYAATAVSQLRQVDDYCHKGSFGHGLLLAGSQNMPGAAVLSASAAMRSGLGKLTVHSAPGVTALLPSVLPEAILDPDENDACISKCRWENLPAFTAAAIGPGIGKSLQTKSLLKSLIEEVRTPLILDADALNLLAEDKTLLAYLPPMSVLTPHVGEFERLAGPSRTEFERIIKLKSFAVRYQAIVVLKGHLTIVAVPGEKDCELMLVGTGNVGMATAGSGDVLTGIMLGLLARTKNPAFSAVLAPYLHGIAGTLALDCQSVESLIASDIVENIGRAFNHCAQFQ